MFLPEKQGGTGAIIVHPDFGTHQASQSEIGLLAASAGAAVLALVIVRVRTIHQSYYLGTGKLEEIRQLTQEKQADLILVNANLSPSQERNLEQLLHCRVIDRNRLILDIFAQRARSHEGKLQVELAQLEYLSTRLVRGWTHLERQKGGIGLRGPGESQLETDKRLLNARVTQLKKQLVRVRKQRQQNRQNRKRLNIPTLALVGYTNAGKSTLFNSLTESDSYVADQLFATLDTTSRRILVPGIGTCILIDTVGFIEQLPHQLIEAFKTTLEEVTLANILIQVVDAGDRCYEDKIHAVDTVLKEMDATNISRIIAFNKVDQLTEEQRHQIPTSIHLGDDFYPAIATSALKGTGQEQLLACIAANLSSSWYHGWLCVGAARAGAIRSEIYELASVQEEKNADNGDLLLHVRLPTSYLKQHNDIKLIESV